MESYSTLPRLNDQTWALHEKCSCMWALNCMFPLSYVEKCHVIKECDVRGMTELSFKFCMLFVHDFQYNILDL